MVMRITISFQGPIKHWAILQTKFATKRKGSSNYSSRSSMLSFLYPARDHSRASSTILDNRFVG